MNFQIVYQGIVFQWRDLLAPFKLEGFALDNALRTVRAEALEEGAVRLLVEVEGQTYCAILKPSTSMKIVWDDNKMPPRYTLPELVWSPYDEAEAREDLRIKATLAALEFDRAIREASGSELTDKLVGNEWVSDTLPAALDWQKKRFAMKQEFDKEIEEIVEKKLGKAVEDALHRQALRPYLPRSHRFGDYNSNIFDEAMAELKSLESDAGAMEKFMKGDTE